VAVHANDKPKITSVTTTASPSPTPTPTPGPTNQEQQDTQAHKDELAQQNQQPTPVPSSGKKSVTPQITSVNPGPPVSIHAFVSGIFENTGTCTATFTKAGYTSVVKASAASAGATTTDCAAITVASTEFPAAGAWTLVLSYSSPTSEGSSASQTVTIQ